ncbi:hypothetical protein V1460_26505 [Streptomyces sp. SCSIO 30461]|uniref:hypothetical protein n=1 Tax=Streptomyces sp. SCSIO 30461 TaxID=3118085 RepID=UPI0030CB6FAE
MFFTHTETGQLFVPPPSSTVPGSSWVRNAAGDSSSPVPTASAERARSQMSVVSTAPGAVVREGFQKVDSS